MTPLAGEYPLLLSLLLFQICVKESTILNERICARVFTQMNNMKLSYKVNMVDIMANEKSNTYNIGARTLGQAFLTIICRHCCLTKVAFSSASLLQRVIGEMKHTKAEYITTEGPVYWPSTLCPTPTFIQRSYCCLKKLLLKYSPWLSNFKSRWSFRK